MRRFIPFLLLALSLPAFALAAVLLCASNSLAQSSSPPAQAALDYTSAHRDDLVRQFSDFLAIPNVVAIPDGLRRNADYLLAQLRQRNIEARLLTVPGDQVPPVVYGSIDTAGATHTIVFYAHYDGQPVTPSDWDIPTPFTPTLRYTSTSHHTDICPSSPPSPDHLSLRHLP